MTVTIGAFTSSILTAQPFGYEGEARQGLTIQAVRFSGLLTPAQWASLTSAYNSWRNSRINDQDTLLSQSVGTTISVSFSANGITWSGVGSWFDAAPTGNQVGAYINASCTLINAAEALAVLLRERELANERRKAEAANVDCTVIAAELQQRKDEADCELAALATGLALDFAEQDIALELQQAQARATAYAAGTADLAAIQGANFDVELLESAAKITALTTGSRLADLKTARALDAVYEKYINEDLPNLGTVTVGSATITLTKPMETRQDGPQVALTTTGKSYITGPLEAHKVRSIEGYISSGTYDDVLSWYDTTIAAVPSAGSWFPTTAPTASAEPFLIGGVKSTRYNVTLTAVKIL